MDKATHAPPPRIALSYREQEKNDEIHRNPCPLSQLSPAVLVDVTGDKDLLRRVFVTVALMMPKEPTHYMCKTSLWVAFYAGMVKYLHLPETADTDTLEKYDSTER